MAAAIISSGGGPKTSIRQASCSTSFSPGNNGYPVYNSARMHPESKTQHQNSQDLVNHNILLRKLERYGAKKIALNWFQSYLTNRIDNLEIINFFRCKYWSTSRLCPPSHFISYKYINELPYN